MKALIQTKKRKSDGWSSFLFFRKVSGLRNTGLWMKFKSIVRTGKPELTFSRSSVTERSPVFIYIMQIVIFLIIIILIMDYLI